MTDHSSPRDRLEGAVDEAKGNAKQAWGEATGDERTQGEGMVDEAKGKGKRALGDLKDAAADPKEGVERSTR